SLNALATRLPAEGKPWNALKEGLSLVLAEASCPRQALPYIERHVVEERTWLFLDALDEVEPQYETQLGRILTALESWPGRVVITSRPYAYAAQRLPFDAVTEYRLAPLTPVHAEEFVDRWGGSAEKAAALKALLSESPAAGDLAQNPFLLTL